MANLDNDGDTAQVKGSGAKPYDLKNKDGVISCSCPAWRNFGGPVDKRTCKHIKQVRGMAAEMARIGVKTHDFGPRGTDDIGKVIYIGGEVGLETGRVQTAVENRSVPPRSSGKKTSFGCACEAGSHCDVSHDPAACGCRQCVTAEAEAKSGKKLRQDEKAKLFGPPILLAHSFEDYPDLDPAGWWYSEKLDGVRAYWNGSEFVSRQGNVYPAPDWFKAGLPDFPLDGELWMGRKMFQKTISVVKSAGSGERWKDVVFRVFDAPGHAGEFEERMKFLHGLEEKSEWKHAAVLLQLIVLGRDHLKEVLDDLVGKGAEGVMIRKPGSPYEVGRSATILKVKPFKDAEAVVIGHVPGKGRLKGMLGGLEVRLPDGKTFNVGTGLTDPQRRSPPKVGCTITYRFTELTDDGIPKCASFVAVRDYE